MDAKRMTWVLGAALGLAGCSAQSGPGEAAAMLMASGAQPARMVATADAVTGPVVRLLGDSDEAVTRFGTVALLRSEDEGVTYLTIDGNPDTVPLDFDHMGLIALVRWPDRDAVMFESDCSGSSCGLPTYWLLELREGAAPQLLDTGDLPFMATDMHSASEEIMSPVLSVQVDGSVRIGSAGDVRNWFVYRPGRVEVRL